MLQRLPRIENINPYRILSLDSEQDSNGDTYIYCITGELYNKRNKTIKKIRRSFTDPIAVSNYLFHQNWNHTILTGFNINYDLNFLKFKGGFEWDVVENMGSFIFARPPKDGKNHLKIIELSSFFPGKTLKTSADSIGYHGHIDKHILGKDGTMEEMIEACFSHCDAAVACFKNIQTQINGLKSNIEITPALTAQKLFLRNYLPPKCQVFDTDIDEDVKLFMNRSYYGGRTEVFQLGTHNHTTGIDLNSSYPTSMRYQIYPDLMTYKEIPITSERQLITTMNKYEGLATVLISLKSNKLHIPFLPYTQNNKLLFPCGIWRGTYTFPELRKAIQLGYKIHNVSRCGIMNRAKQPMFKKYIDDLYKLKTDPTYKQIAKLMLNSLYGKFGQKANYDSGWILVENTDDYENIIIDDKHFRIYNGLLYEYIPKLSIKEQGFAPKSYPIIAAYVTSYSRILLYDAMQQIGFENIYYCDTDSIYGYAPSIQLAIDKNFLQIDPKKLGFWDIEHEDITMQIKGLKHYRLFENNEWIYVTKGVPKKSMSCYWRHGSARISRVRKMNSAIRFSKKVNEFYSLLRVNRDKDQKRFFHNNKHSIPFTING